MWKMRWRALGLSSGRSSSRGFKFWSVGHDVIPSILINRCSWGEGLNEGFSNVEDGSRKFFQLSSLTIVGWVWACSLILGVFCRNTAVENWFHIGQHQSIPNQIWIGVCACASHSCASFYATAPPFSSMFCVQQAAAYVFACNIQLPIHGIWLCFRQLHFLRGL